MTKIPPCTLAPPLVISVSSVRANLLPLRIVRVRQFHSIATRKSSSPQQALI
ncbi:MAG: hypothetical protein AB1589_35400 [Cyanobacteriota bacterium]